MSANVVSAFSQSPASEIKNVQTIQIQGDVLTRDNNVLTIKTNNGTKQVTIPSGVNLTRNTIGAKIGDIQPNDKVTITQTSDGKVISIDDTAGSVFDFGKWALPLFILFIIACIVIWMLVKRANKSHIKTTIE